MGCFCFLCTSRLLKLGDFAEYFSPCHSLLPVSMSLPINHLSLLGAKNFELQNPSFKTNLNDRPTYGDIFTSV